MPHEPYRSKNMRENSAKPQDRVFMPAESTWEVCESEGNFLPLGSEWKINYKTEPIDNKLISYLWFTQLPLNPNSEILYTIKATPIFTSNHSIYQGILTKINNFLITHLSLNHPIELELKDSEILLFRLINETSQEKKTEEYILKLKEVNE